MFQRSHNHLMTLSGPDPVSSDNGQTEFWSSGHNNACGAGKSNGAINKFCTSSVEFVIRGLSAV